MYQEETYETNHDEAREAAQLADAEDRFEGEAEEMLATLWAGTETVDARPMAPASEFYRRLAVELLKETA
jgi:hypothetical protein